MIEVGLRGTYDPTPKSQHVFPPHPPLSSSGTHRLDILPLELIQLAIILRGIIHRATRGCEFQLPYRRRFLFLFADIIERTP